MHELDREEVREQPEAHAVPTEPCPVCGFPIVAIAGSKQAICQNCGYKEPCC